jgi:putative transposase
VDAATKASLLDLVDDAIEEGWSLRRACHQLDLAERRVHRWLTRRAGGRLVDQAPGGSPTHGLLAAEAEEILALFDEWGDRPVAPQARPPRLLPAPGLGVALVGSAGAFPC